MLLSGNQAVSHPVVAANEDHVSSNDELFDRRISMKQRDCTKKLLKKKSDPLYIHDKDLDVLLVPNQDNGPLDIVPNFILFV